ncbi:MAG: tetratricopeptide repeat protein [Ignavibacterium sp.]
MKYYLYIFLFSLIILSSCSSNKEISKETFSNGKRDVSNSISNEEKKERALNHFIDGMNLESKSNFADAVIEFQKALSFDSSSGIFYELSKNYLFLNRIPLALNNAKKAIELEPNNIEYNFLLQEIYVSANNYDSASVILEKIIQIDSTNIDAYYRLARLYEKERPLKAIEVYNKLSRLIGDDWNVLSRKAELYERLGYFDESINSTEKLITLDPSNIPLKNLLIELYEKNKQYDKALEIVNDIIRSYPDNLEARERKAQLYINQDDWYNASKEYNYILEQPNVPLDIKIRIAASFFSASFNDSTLLPLTKSLFTTIDKDTIDWQVKLYLGAIASLERNDSLAEKNFNLVTELAPWNSEGWVRLGGLYFDNHRYDDAIKILSKAIEKFPEDFMINLLLGISYSQKDDYQTAEKYLQKAVQLNPNDINALSSYGYTLNRLGNKEDAILYLKKALAIDSTNVNLLGTLGLIYDDTEQWEQCDSIYSLALKIDSLNPTINNNYAYALSKRKIRLDEALKMAEIAIKAEPNNSSFLDTIGWIYFMLSDYEKAKNYIEESLQIGGERAEVLEHLGDVIFMLGKKDEALSIWKKAFELDQSNSTLKSKIERGTI